MLTTGAAGVLAGLAVLAGCAVPADEPARPQTARPPTIQPPATSTPAPSSAPAVPDTLLLPAARSAPEQREDGPCAAPAR